MFAAWTTTTWGEVSESTTGHLAETTERLQRSMKFDIVNCDDGEMYLRNVGSKEVDISTGELGLYINNSLDVGTWTVSNGTHYLVASDVNLLGPNQIGNRTVTDLQKADLEIRIGTGTDVEAVDVYSCP